MAKLDRKQKELLKKAFPDSGVKPRVPKKEPKKPYINKPKADYLEEGTSRNCVSNFTKKGMSAEEAQKHCNSLWQKELKKRATGRTVDV